MHRPGHNPRTPEADIDSMFTDRWSPRGFEPCELSDKMVSVLFEAARWAPSCYNEQPWIFLYACREEEKRLFASALVEKNRQWADRASMIAYLAVRSTFAKSGKPNRHASFDAGSAWMSLALQARKLGLHAHAMAGFNGEKARDILQLPPDFELMVAIAVGSHGDSGRLPDDLRAMESPNTRKPLTDVAARGAFRSR